MKDAEKKVRMLAHCMGFRVGYYPNKVAIYCDELYLAADPYNGSWPVYKFSYPSWRHALKWMPQLKRWYTGRYTGWYTGPVGAIGPIGRTGVQGVTGTIILPEEALMDLET